MRRAQPSFLANRRRRLAEHGTSRPCWRQTPNRRHGPCRGSDTLNAASGGNMSRFGLSGWAKQVTKLLCIYHQNGPFHIYH